VAEKAVKSQINQEKIVDAEEIKPLALAKEGNVTAMIQAISLAKESP